MHELPIVTDLIEILKTEAKEKKLSHIKSITLVIGELSSVIGESVQMYFDILSEGTPCEGARLIFKHRYAMLRCTSCGNEFEHIKGFDCPRCGGESVLIKGTGQELYIETIDAE